MAFSGDHKYKGQEPALTSAAMNGFLDAKIPKEFKKDPYRILIVADMFQTGFDEPLLHTMYVDKPLYVYLFHPSAFDVLSSWNFYSSFSVLHILWGVWVVDMAAQLIPVGKRIALGSQKLFLFRFQPRKEAINYEALKAHIVDTTKGAYKVFLIWVGMLGILAVLYFTQILGRNEIFLICVAFYVCDLICVLIWCPFRLITAARSSLGIADTSCSVLYSSCRRCSFRLRCCRNSTITDFASSCTFFLGTRCPRCIVVLQGCCIKNWKGT